MKIIFATDGSDFSRAAIEKGCGLIANVPELSVKVISAVAMPYVPATEPLAVSADYYREMEGELTVQARERVEDAKRAIGERLPDADVSGQVFVGQPDRAIVEAAQEWEADLVIVGSHGYGFWKRMFLGSVSQAVVQYAPCSVLVVRKASGDYV